MKVCEWAFPSQTDSERISRAGMGMRSPSALLALCWQGPPSVSQVEVAGSVWSVAPAPQSQTRWVCLELSSWRVFPVEHHFGHVLRVSFGGSVMSLIPSCGFGRTSVQILNPFLLLRSGVASVSWPDAPQIKREVFFPLTRHTCVLCDCSPPAMALLVMFRPMQRELLERTECWGLCSSVGAICLSKAW